MAAAPAPEGRAKMRRIALMTWLVLSGCREAPAAGSAPPEVAEQPADAGAPEVTGSETSEARDPFRDLGWTAVSQDGTAALTQTHVGDGKCVRSCTDAPEGREVWRAEGCIGKRLDLRFVGNDCEKVAVLHQLPEVRSGESWRKVRVAHVYARDRLAYPVEAAGAVQDLKKLRSAGSTFYWLQGALGQPGPGPRYSADGAAVEFVTLDGRAQAIPLQP